MCGFAHFYVQTHENFLWSDKFFGITRQSDFTEYTPLLAKNLKPITLFSAGFFEPTGHNSSLISEDQDASRMFMHAQDYAQMSTMQFANSTQFQCYQYNITNQDGFLLAQKGTLQLCCLLIVSASFNFLKYFYCSSLS